MAFSALDDLAVEPTSDQVAAVLKNAIDTVLGIAYSTSSVNYSCPRPQPTGVTIGGPTSVAINGTACQTVTWTTSVTGGTAPYTYAWTLNGAAAGSGSSLSKQYCGNDTNSTSTQNVGVTVDGIVSDTHSTNINYTYTPPVTCNVTINGPTSVVGTSCKTLSWTSTVNCGSPHRVRVWQCDGYAHDYGRDGLPGTGV